MSSLIFESRRYLSPMTEMAAYEALWDSWRNISYRKLAMKFADSPWASPSSFVEDDIIEKYRNEVIRIARGFSVSLSVLLNHTCDYPARLRDAEYPVELLYAMGNLEYLHTRGISVVGTRHPSGEGISRTRKLVRMLVENDFTIYSGLAEGIDTAAHTAAIGYGGRTVAVIGTPLDIAYPRSNSSLQGMIAAEHLLISQVPFLRYKSQDFRINRAFFPERNKTMSALSEATVIVEAGETSGSLIQAHAALKQGRKLFILSSCFENKAITWPQRLEKKGAIRVREFGDIISNL